MTVVVLTEIRPPTIVDAKVKSTVPDWLDGLLAEVERLVEEGSNPPLDTLEQSLLRTAGEELRGLVGRTGPVGLAGLILAGHLAGAEQASRVGDPARASVYALALRGLDKLLAKTGVDEAGSSPSRLGRGSPDGPTLTGAFRLLRRLLGLPALPPFPS